LAYYNLTAESPESVRVIKDPLGEALDLRAEGDRLTEAKQFEQAIKCYEVCLEALSGLRATHSGDDFAYLDNEITWTNVRIRAARHYAAYGAPPDGPPCRSVRTKRAPR